MSNGYFWGPIPVYILQDHRHRGGHLRVLAAILSCPQPHFPSLKTIAERSGHTPKYCSKMVSQMVAFGTLEREQRYRDTNVYKLVSYSDCTPVVGSDSTTVVALKESLKEKNKKSPPKQDGCVKFCSRYPRHRLGVQKKIAQYWRKNKLETVADNILKCLREHNESIDWKSEEGKWVPGAMKFLEQERWLLYSDDPLAQFEED